MLPLAAVLPPGHGPLLEVFRWLAAGGLGYLSRPGPPAVKECPSFSCPGCPRCPDCQVDVDCGLGSAALGAFVLVLSALAGVFALGFLLGRCTARSSPRAAAEAERAVPDNQALAHQQLEVLRLRRHGGGGA